MKLLPLGPAPRRSRGVKRRRKPGFERTLLVLVILLCLGVSGGAEVLHVIARGETLSGIAREYNVSVSAIAGSNQIADPHRIYAGRSLTIPASPSTVAAPTGVPSAATSEHRIAPGETLSQIAARFGVTVADLVAVNNLSNPNRIVAGRTLTIPSGPPGPEQLMVTYARRYGVDPNLVKAVAWQESGWQQHVISPVGAVGVMQVMPGTGVFIGKRLLGEPVDLHDLESNIKAGTRFLAYLIQLTGGDEQQAVAGYYQGLRNVRNHGMSASTERYLANVLALRERFRASG